MQTFVRPLLIAASTLAPLLAVQPLFAQEPPKPAGEITLQNNFDPIGAEVHQLDQNGRAIFYIDEGPRDGRVVVFIGGAGTSLEAFQLTEFARSSREALGLRVISVERNGFGESAFDPALGYGDYNAEILAVLAHLGVERFAVMAISGGGAYAAHLAAAVPDRVISLHLGAAVARTLPTRSDPKACASDPAEVKASSEKAVLSPKEWWAVPGSPVLVVPGWQTRAYADATRSFYIDGANEGAAALAHERLLICGGNAVVDAAKITAPTYLYYGDADKAVTPEEMRQWQEALPNIARATLYPDEGHTVQYRHWDQILADMAGYGDHTVVCREGESALVPAADVTPSEKLGICAWHPAE
ncbi:alpha/beta fold hydrolase [Paracoccus cavernae]|uniref:alpha/beta fold hydrolase n=1 Tax=Paracoccus cavernae TaxID=1571207 RepID=UPI0035F33760